MFWLKPASDVCSRPQEALGADITDFARGIANPNMLQIWDLEPSPIAQVQSISFN